MITSHKSTSLLQQVIIDFLGLMINLLRRATREKLIIPVIIKLLNIRIISNTELRTNIQKYHAIYFGSEEFIKTGSSKIVGNMPISIQHRSLQEFNLLNPWISEINDAELIGLFATGLDEKGNIISSSTLPPIEDLSHRFEGGLPANTFLAKLPVVKTIELDLACSLVNSWSKNYYHWIIDCLVRLEGVEYYQQHTNSKPLLIINSNPTSWQIESLKLLGYTPEDYIQWNVAKAKVKKLVVPSFRRQGEWVAPSSLHWLRERILNNLPPGNENKLNYPENIYISRSKASGRRVINENEVLEFLKPLGFVCFSLEGMSFVEQVRLFSTAKNIIAPHGAGLTNMIFAPKNTNVVELINPWVSSSYFVPAQILGFTHAALECQQSYIQKLRRSKGDLVVDISKLKRLIKGVF